MKRSFQNSKNKKGVKDSNEHLDPLNFCPHESLKMKLARKEFEELVVSSLKGIPKYFREKMENVDVVVEDQAPTEVLSEMGMRSPFELLGLYQGVPLDRRGFFYGNVLPDKITLFQIPIESICKTKKEIEEKIKEVVIHEIGHYFGLDEERLQELESE